MPGTLLNFTPTLNQIGGGVDFAQKPTRLSLLILRVHEFFNVLLLKETRKTFQKVQYLSSEIIKNMTCHYDLELYNSRLYSYCLTHVVP